MDDLWPNIGALLGGFLMTIVKNASNIFQKPKITVEPISYEDDENGYLKVTNKGFEANFEVSLLLLQELREGKWLKFGADVNLYDGIWRKSDTNKTEIGQGDFDYIKLSHIRFENGGQTLELPHYATPAKKLEHFWTPSTPDYVPQPEYVVRVTITSIPSQRCGPFIKAYHITLDKIETLEEVLKTQRKDIKLEKLLPKICQSLRLKSLKILNP
jgi:hypothetical protein